MQLVCLLIGSRLVIDWHNTGASILALRLGERHIAVRLAAWYARVGEAHSEIVRLERTFGARAHAHLFVTDAMRHELSETWQMCERPLGRAG